MTNMQVLSIPLFFHLLLFSLLLKKTNAGRRMTNLQSCGEGSYQCSGREGERKNLSFYFHYLKQSSWTFLVSS